MLFLPNYTMPQTTFLGYILPQVEITHRKFNPHTYTGQGSRIIKKTLPYVAHLGETIIVLVEGCGNISKHNYSGFRKADGSYHEFESLESWGKTFRKVMDRKYKKSPNETVAQWFDRISHRYNPEHREEWLERCGYWLQKLKQT